MFLLVFPKVFGSNFCIIIIIFNGIILKRCTYCGRYTSITHRIKCSYEQISISGGIIIDCDLKLKMLPYVFEVRQILFVNVSFSSRKLTIVTPYKPINIKCSHFKIS